MYRLSAFYFARSASDLPFEATPSLFVFIIYFMVRSCSSSMSLSLEKAEAQRWCPCNCGSHRAEICQSRYLVLRDFTVAECAAGCICLAVSAVSAYGTCDTITP